MTFPTTFTYIDKHTHQNASLSLTSNFINDSVPQILFISVTQSYLTLCDPMNHSTPGLPPHHQLPEFTQTHVHWVSDAIQPSHPLPSPSSPAFKLPASGSFLMSWLFVSGDQSIGASASASVLLMNIQDWFPLGLTGLIDSFRFWYPVCLVKLQSKCCHDKFF